MPRHILVEIEKRIRLLLSYDRSRDWLFTEIMRGADNDSLYETLRKTGRGRTSLPYYYPIPLDTY